VIFGDFDVQSHFGIGNRIACKMGPPKGESHWQVQKKKFLGDNAQLEIGNKDLLANVKRLEKDCRENAECERGNLVLCNEIKKKLVKMKQVIVLLFV